MSTSVNLKSPERNKATDWLPDVSLYAKMKILIIDDEPANVALLEDVVSSHGYTRVRSITDSRLARDTFDSFAPDLIFLDLMMPHVDGFAILESVRSAAGDTFLPVIVLTADANEGTRLRALRAGATDFLLKPFDEIEVLLRMANLLETRRLYLQLDTQRAAYEDAVRDRTSELREAQSQLQEVQR